MNYYNTNGNQKEWWLLSPEGLEIFQPLMATYQNAKSVVDQTPLIEAIHDVAEVIFIPL